MVRVGPLLGTSLALDHSLGLEDLATLPAHVHQRAHEVGHRDEQEHQVEQAAIKSEALRDSKLGVLGLVGDRVSHEDDEHADEVLKRESDRQQRNVDPLDRVDLVTEAHVQVHPIEVAEQLAEGA